MKRFFLIFMLLFMVSGMVFYTGCKKSDLNDPPDMSVVGVKWILESIQYSARNVITIEEMFYILLKEDFRVEMEVDCNYCAGSYALGNNNFILFDYSTIACTEADCGDDSLDEEFHEALNTASRYEVDGNRLRVYFNNEQSQLNFIAAPAALGPISKKLL
ncbi:MAG: META domain-containing protein [Candidatus Aminicenantes bacterium]|nr:MAG: META domain-containing protein [Candidatus Aminicenantes bacterium]